ncbi:PAC2 family protein [Microcella flavibacter]|uniref:PAC2 family protein n=1 Tax=Microcella flavibacter TaxID=1804990 RepID=UPI0014564F39|nr:PAC2 family protein [Microcella flavibacter]
MTSTDLFRSGRLLVVAFEGWNDAGEAASGAVKALKEVLDVVEIADIDPEDYYDFQLNRPQIETTDDGRRVLRWPSVTMFGPANDDGLPRDVVPEAPLNVSGTNHDNIYLLVGTEPSRGWRTFATETMDQALTADITGIIMLGALLADVPHSRPIAVHASSENAQVREELEIERSTYEGPVGILSVIAAAAEEVGIPVVTLWASVPHYVHNAPSPKAILALLDKLEEFVDVTIPRGDLVDEARAWEEGIDSLAEDDEEMSSYIVALERARDAVEAPEASGEAIAQEFERYLRTHEDDEEPGEAQESDDPDAAAPADDEGDSGTGSGPASAA